MFLPLASNAQSGLETQQLAGKIVNNVLHAHAGDVVVITASPSSMPLVEELVVHLRQVGAWGIPVVGSNRINKLYYQRVPAKFDSQTPESAMRLASIATAYITIDYPFDPSVFKGVPVTRLSALGQAANPVTTYILKHNIPTIDIGNGILPSPATAANYAVSEDALSALFWSGLNTDYGRLRRDARTVSTVLNGSHLVRITAPNGTNFSFRTAAGTVLQNDGTISASDIAKGGAAVAKQLPAGDVYVLAAPGSAHGTLVFGPAQYGGTRVAGLKMQFAGGKMTAIHADSGLATVRRTMAAATAGRDLFSWADIGVNRAMRVGDGDWGPGPSMAAGYLTVGVGSDVVFGGSNQSTFSWSSNIPKATISVDGQRIVSGGRLLL